MNGPTPTRGSIAWMARHPVAANLLMPFLLLGGLLVGLQDRIMDNRSGAHHLHDLGQ